MSHEGIYAELGWDRDLSVELADAKANAAGWDRPMPFHESNAPPFPTEGLPRWMREFVEATAVATQTPPDIAAVLSLASIASCVHRRLRVDINAGYSEPLNLYVVCVMASGERKSPVVRAATAAIARYESDETKRIAPEVEAAQSQRRMDEKRRDRAEDEAAKCSSEERSALEEAAKQLAAELAARPRLYSPRLLADDVTPEQLATLLLENGGRISVLAAEGTIFEQMCGRYDKNGNANLDNFLKAHAAETIRVDRRSRPPEHIELPALTLGLAVQPEVIRGLMSNRLLRGKGLLARFLYSVPTSKVGHRDPDPPAVPGDVESNYGRTLQAMLSMKIPEDAAIALSADALLGLVGYRGGIEARLGLDGDLHHIGDWANKLTGAVARIAALLHVAKHADKEPWSLPIDADTMRSAMAIGDYFTAHALVAFAEMGADPALENAKAVHRWLQRRGEPLFSKREAFNALRSRFRNVQAIDPAIEVLVQHGWVRLTVDEPAAGRSRGRPASPVYEVNPVAFVHTQKSQNTQKSNSADSAICAPTGGP